MRFNESSSRAGRWWVVCAALVAAAPAWAQIETAGELFVDLDADDPTAGTDVWENAGSIGDFLKVGNPALVAIDGVVAVEFNPAGLAGDAYRCEDPAPAGLTGLDPTRTIEVWAYNPAIEAEETLVTWGGRGGPAAGSNISFNYGTNGAFGAVGHWGDPDIGWINTGGAPEAGKWHHLVYTYDGTTTRVYADGALWNQEVLGAGAINTHPNAPIALAAQWTNPAGTTLDTANGGTLSIARVRVHDGVLTLEQIRANFAAEGEDFGFVFESPAWGAAPENEFYLAGETTYGVPIQPPTGLPPPDLTAISPVGAAIDANGFVTYAIPDPEPASFTVTVRAANVAGSSDLSWSVTRATLPPAGQVARAGTLLVDLDAADPSAGGAVWENLGTLGDFERLGAPVLDDIGGVLVVTFNPTVPVGDAYKCVDPAPPGIVGLNATRSIEVWVLNPAVADEETLLSWGRRGGPDGSNMSFNYGTSQFFGAAGHWGGADIGWNDAGGAPSAGGWHHLAYTYDGTTTRVYADGQLANQEVLGPNVINTHAGTAILLAAQWENETTPLVALGGTLSLARVRVHDGVLRPSQILHNFETEKSDFLQAPEFVDAPAEDSAVEGRTYRRQLSVVGNPKPVVAVEAPSGATISEGGLLEYALPDPAPDSFDVRVTATSAEGSAEAAWTVTVIRGALLESGPVHRYSFEADASDSIEGADGVVYGNVVFADGQADFQNDGSQNSNGTGVSPPAAPPGAYIDLPNGIISALGTQATFETWFTWRGPAGSFWQRVWDFGTSVDGENSSRTGDAVNYVFLTPQGGPGALRCGYNVGGPPRVERVVDSAVPPLDVPQHVAVTWDDEARTVRMYVNGVLVAEDLEKQLEITLATLPDVNNWLGRSQWPDAMYNGLIDEFRIYERALTHEEIVGNLKAGPDVVNTEPGPVEICDNGIDDDEDGLTDCDDPDCAEAPNCQGARFRRGDADASDGVVNITDAIFVLNYLFQGGSEPPCLDAADADNEFGINITDGIYILSFLFLGGPEPPDPGPFDCGIDPPVDPPSEPEPKLDCKSYPPEC